VPAIPSSVSLPEPESRVYRMFLVAAVMVSALVFAAVSLSFCQLIWTGNHSGSHDFVSFWTAGQQIVQHANPYDGAAVLKMERAVGFPPDHSSLIMRNPPWALVLVMPLGLVGLRAATLLWTLLLLASLLASVHMLWRMHGSPKGPLHLLAYSFGPAVSCLLAGQSALFSLLGIVLFLRLHRRNPFLAGVALWLCAAKLHLFLPFWFVLFLWGLRSRSYRVFAGLGTALVASLLAAYALDHGVWSQYGQMMRTAGLEDEFIPCLGIVLRFAVHKQATWLQYLPAAAGCVWSISFYWRNRDQWDWMEHSGLLLLVSIMTAPYAWITDQALLVPAILQGIYLATTRGQLAILALAGAVLEIQMMAGVTMHSILVLWTTVFWISWYLYVASRARSAHRGSVGQLGEAIGSL
jgi:hypothetical protein